VREPAPHKSLTYGVACDRAIEHLIPQNGAARTNSLPHYAAGGALIPEWGWELLLSETAPVAGAAWTASGDRRDRHQLKQ
jgi:hypothetical protein